MLEVICPHHVLVCTSFSWFELYVRNTLPIFRTTLNDILICSLECCCTDKSPYKGPPVMLMRWLKDNVNNVQFVQGLGTDTVQESIRFRSANVMQRLAEVEKHL
jgi:hypothetical protein